MAQLWTTLFLISGSLVAGYLIQIYFRRYLYTRMELLNKAASIVQTIVIMFIEPLILLSAFWGIQLSFGTLFLFPLIGLLSHAIGGISARFISRYFKHGHKQTGAFFTAGSFTNLGSFGGLVALMYYGEPGYALAMLFKLFTPIFYFGIGFPIAQMYSDDFPSGSKWRFELKSFKDNKLVLPPLAAIFIGFALFFCGIARPSILGDIVAPAVKISTAMMLVSVGLYIRPAAIRGYIREGLATIGIKNLLLPTVLTLIGLILGYGKLNEGLPLKVLITMGSMPVAFNALVPPLLYDLDVDLTNSSWLISTIFFIIVSLPLLYLVKLL